MKIYLYLDQHAYVDTWVNGGNIPISPASKYLSDERSGIYTPDENMIHDSPVDLRSLSPAIHIENSRDITILNSSINGKKIPNIRNANFYREDGLILSFCNKLNTENKQKFETKKACIQIVNIYKLKREIDKQLGCKGEMKKCRYTHDHQRNHFLKSIKDEWQDEFRIFWRIERPAVTWVTISENAVLVEKW